MQGQAPALFRWLDLPRLFTLAVLLVLLVPAIQPVTDPDFWWHLTTGNWMLSHHAIPRHDLYTYTVSNHRWITHEWLSEIFLAVLFALGKLPLVSIVLGLITYAGFLLVYRTIDRRANFLIAGLSLALGVAAANPVWGPRIQMITFALTALTVLLIRRFSEGRSRALLLFPLLMVLWANLHAGFIIGDILLTVALLLEAAKLLLRNSSALPARRVKQLAFVWIGSMVAPIINPNGWDLYLYPLQTQFSSAQEKLIVEWFSPNFHMPEIRAFEGMLFLLLIGLALARRVDLQQFAFLLLGLALALQSVRNLSLFMIVAVPPLADYSQQAWERLRGQIGRRSTRPRPTNATTFTIGLTALTALLAVVLIALLPDLGQRVDGKLVRRDFPVEAADFLAAHPAPGHMLNSYGWGGYLVFRLFPGQPVFIYGDAAVSGDQLLNDYSQLQYLGPQQTALLDRYGVNWVIFRNDDSIITELRQDRSGTGHIGWFELHTFGKAVLMMRDTPENRAYAAASGM